MNNKWILYCVAAVMLAFTQTTAMADASVKDVPAEIDVTNILDCSSSFLQGYNLLSTSISLNGANPPASIVTPDPQCTGLTYSLPQLFTSGAGSSVPPGGSTTTLAILPAYATFYEITAYLHGPPYNGCISALLYNTYDITSGSLHLQNGETYYLTTPFSVGEVVPLGLDPSYPFPDDAPQGINYFTHTETPGVVGITFQCTSQGVLGPVPAGTIHGSVTASSGGALAASLPSLSTGSGPTYLLVRNGTANITVNYTTGTDPATDLINWPPLTFNSINVTPCALTALAANLPACPSDVGGLISCGGAAITGTLEMSDGETEWPTTFSMFASGGPAGNSRVATFSGNTFTAINVVPSGFFGPPEQPYTLQGGLGFGTYYNYEYFTTPDSATVEYSADAIACQTNDTYQTFVMCPGHVQGNITLSGPAYTGTLSLSPWSSLQWAQSFPPAGGPPNINPQLNQLNTCFVHALDTAGSGEARVLFPKDSISADGSTFNSHYDLRLAGLSLVDGTSTSSQWNPNDIHLRFSSPSGTTPADDIQESLDIIDNNFTGISVSCGSQVINDINYCFGEVLLTVVDSDVGDTSYASISVTGTGILPNGNSSSFNATGTPVTGSSGQVSVPVRLFLPEGLYQNVTITVYTKGGGAYTLPATTFESICGAKIVITPGAPVFSLDGPPACLSSSNTSATITVISPPQDGDQYTISYMLNGTGPFNVCGNNNSCANPVTLNNIPLQPGKNAIIFIVKDTVNGLTTTVKKTVYYEQAPISISCNDILLQMPALQNTVQVDYNLKGNIVVSGGSSPVAVTYNPDNLSSFPVGTTPVTCSVTDPCSSNFCTFNVIVTPPPCFVITNEYFTCDTNVPGGYIYHFDAINDQSDPIQYLYFSSLSASCLNANPPYYYFPSPLGTGGQNPQSASFELVVNPGCGQQQFCFYLTAYDLQNSVVCSIQHCFNNPELPVISCPPDISADCTNDTGAFVSYTLPAATSVCCAPVTVTALPPPGTFPIGVTPVKVTAVDSCGHTNYCQFNVTVRGHSSNQDQPRNLRHDGISGDIQMSEGIAVDSSGSVYITGWFSGTAHFGNTVLGSSGGKDIFLAKFNSDLTGPVWVQKAGGPGDDVASAVAVDSQGNCYITGYMDNANGLFPSVSFLNSPVDPSAMFYLATDISTSSDLFLAKYDPQGNLLWVAPGGGNGEPGDSAEGLAIDGNDIPYVCGSYHSAVTWFSGNGGLVDTTTLNGDGSYDAYLIMYDPTGIPLRGISTKAGPNNGGYTADARSVAIDNVHKTASLVGTFTGTPAFGTSSIGPSGQGFGRVFVAQCSIPTPGSDPVWNWAKQTVCPNGSLFCSHDGRQIGVDSSGNCYFTAYFNGQATIGTGTVTPAAGNPNYDYLLGSFDLNGNHRWLKSGGGGGDDETRALAVKLDTVSSEADGDVYLTGFLRGVNSSVDGGTNIMLLHYDKLGNREPLAVQHYAYGSLANAQNTGRGVALDKAGCVYFTGTYTDNHVDFSDFQTSQISLGHVFDAMDGNPKTFIAKYCPRCEECFPPVLASGPQPAIINFEPTSYPVSFTVNMSGSTPMNIIWTHGTWGLGTIALNPTGGDIEVFPPAAKSHYKIVLDPSGTSSTLTLWGDLDADCPTCDNFPYSVIVTNSCGEYGAALAPAYVGHFGINPGYTGGGNVALRINLPVSVPYTIQYRDSLVGPGVWHDLTNGMGTGGLNQIVDPSPNPTNRFYRMKIPAN